MARFFFVHFPFFFRNYRNHLQFKDKFYDVIIASDLIETGFSVSQLVDTFNFLTPIHSKEKDRYSIIYSGFEKKDNLWEERFYNLMLKRWRPQLVHETKGKKHIPPFFSLIDFVFILFSNHCFIM